MANRCQLIHPPHRHSQWEARKRLLFFSLSFLTDRRRHDCLYHITIMYWFQTGQGRETAKINYKNPLCSHKTISMDFYGQWIKRSLISINERQKRPTAAAINGCACFPPYGPVWFGYKSVHTQRNVIKM